MKRVPPYGRPHHAVNDRGSDANPTLVALFWKSDSRTVRKLLSNSDAKTWLGPEAASGPTVNVVVDVHHWPA